MTFKPVPREADFTLMIDDNFRGTGFGGCNYWSATFYPMRGQPLAAGPVATTKKHCTPTVMQLERAFLVGVHSGPEWDLVGPELVLKGKGGTPASNGRCDASRARRRFHLLSAHIDIRHGVAAGGIETSPVRKGAGMGKRAIAFFVTTALLLAGAAALAQDAKGAVSDSAILEKNRKESAECYACHSEAGFKTPPRPDMYMAKLRALVAS